jgi:hypothetical protein
MSLKRVTRALHGADIHAVTVRSPRPIAHLVRMTVTVVALLVVIAAAVPLAA